MSQIENKSIDGFSCVEYKNRTALELHERLRRLSDAEVAKYWKSRNAAFIRAQRKFSKSNARAKGNS